MFAIERLVIRQKTQKRTSDALALVEQLTGKSQEMADLVEQEQANLDIARKIYELRTKAKLSQAELARKVGTTQSVISRLEDADYNGHPLALIAPRFFRFGSLCVPTLSANSGSLPLVETPQLWLR